jgi:hypothetical protein
VVHHDCDDGGAAIAASWTPAARDAISRKLIAIDRPSATSIIALVDGWADRWRDASIHSCRATERGGWNDATAADSQRCLDAGLARFHDLLATARAATDVESVAALRVTAAALPIADACVDRHQLAADQERLRAPELRPAGATTGYWAGNFGGHVLRLIDGEVWGVYSHDEGTLRGTLDGDTFRGWWCEAPSRLPPTDAGELELHLGTSADGTPTMNGRWRYGSDGPWHNDWDMTWTDVPPTTELLVRFDDPTQFCKRP